MRQVPKGNPFNMTKTNSGGERIFIFYKSEFTIINIDKMPNMQFVFWES